MCWGPVVEGPLQVSQSCCSTLKEHFITILANIKNKIKYFQQNLCSPVHH